MFYKAHFGKCWCEESFITLWTETPGGCGVLFFFFEREGCLFFMIGEQNFRVSKGSEGER